MKRIYFHCGALKNVNSPFENDSDLIRNNYLMGYCKIHKTKPQSIIKYLSSLKDFCTFLKRKKIGNYEDVKATKRNIKLWTKKYRKPAGKEKIKSKWISLYQILSFSLSRNFNTNSIFYFKNNFYLVCSFY